MSEILPNLWLGPIGLTYESDFLQENNIQRIVTVYDKYHFTSAMTNLRIQSFQIKIYDTDDAPIGDSFEDATTFIEEALRKNEGVYVHCFAGVSRSPTIVAAYLMRYYGFSVNDALQYIKERRPIIAPNDGFREALSFWERGIAGLK